MTDSREDNLNDRPESSRVDALDPSGANGEHALAAVLSGELHCLSCRYDLTGLSVTTACPECGLPVRATLLAVVDPKATSFVPLATPRVSALGLLFWSGGALLAALMVFVVRLVDMAGIWFGLTSSVRNLGVMVPIFAAVSMIGAFLVSRPHRQVPRSVVARGYLSVLLYAPLVYLLWRLHAEFDVLHGPPYVDEPIRQTERAILRLSIGGLILIIALLLRPIMREYAARSVLMRTGQITRQTLAALASAVMIVMAGDLLHLLTLHTPAIRGALMHIVWLTFVLVGSLMILIGFAGMFWDSVRLYPVLRRGPTALGDVVRKERFDAA